MPKPKFQSKIATKIATLLIVLTLWSNSDLSWWRFAGLVALAWAIEFALFVAVQTIFEIKKREVGNDTPS